MTKTLIEIDDDYLAAAQQALGTTTKKDTVNAALREFTALAARRRDLRKLTRAGGPSLAASSPANQLEGPACERKPVGPAPPDS